MSKDDFASMFESSAASGDLRSTRRLSAGEVVEGTVIEISGGSVFVDVGGQADAQIDLTEFDDRALEVGMKVRATVLKANPEAPVLTVSVGRGGAALDTTTLHLAQEAGTPVNGTVTQAVKGGVSVDIGGIRAFCPASQLERGYVENFDEYVGQTFDFKIVEIKEEGRNVIVSRRALLDERHKLAAQELANQLEVGATVHGTVKNVVRHGAVIDLGGGDGFVHISELARHRVERVEDVVSVGEEVDAQVISIDHGERGLSIRLSLKALSAGDAGEAPQKDEVLDGEVVKHVGNGLIVKTAKGDGLVPVRELDLPPGADHRRAYPTGRTLRVVLVARDPASGKLRFSVGKVADVEERANYREFSRDQKGKSGGASLGSFGDLLAGKLAGLKTAPAPVPAQPAAKPQARAPEGPTEAPRTTSHGPSKGRVARDPFEAPPVRPEQKKAPQGVHRRKR